MLLLALKNLARRPLRNGLTLAGLSAAVAVLVCLSGFSRGYERALAGEINHMGIQLMLVPLGCPYDAAARVLKGKVLDNTLPESALEQARKDPAVAIAAPLLLATLPRPEAGRADMWVGLDKSALELKPWWRASAGKDWFEADDSLILGFNAAEIEMRAPGDRFFSPETKHAFHVTGVLERSGTSDDSLLFVPLKTAQHMFNLPGKLTAIAVRLHDPAQLRQATQRLQNIPGAQVVTLAEMMGVFLNLVGAARALLTSVAWIAVVVSVLSVFNTLLAAVVERTNELAVLRAIGASRFQLLALIGTEAGLLTASAAVIGFALAVIAGQAIETFVKEFLPLAPTESLLALTPGVVLQGLLVAGVAGLVGGLYPAWRASRIHPASALKFDLL